VQNQHFTSYPSFYPTFSIFLGLELFQLNSYRVTKLHCSSWRLNQATIRVQFTSVDWNLDGNFCVINSSFADSIQLGNAKIYSGQHWTHRMHSFRIGERKSGWELHHEHPRHGNGIQCSIEAYDWAITGWASWVCICVHRLVFSRHEYYQQCCFIWYVFVSHDLMNIMGCRTFVTIFFC